MLMLKNIYFSQAVMAHAINPSTRKAEAGRVRGQSGLQELVPGQSPKLQRNLVSKNKQTNKQSVYFKVEKYQMPHPKTMIGK